MEWISVEDRMPKNLDMVLVWSNTALIPTMAYRFNSNDWFYYSIGSGNFPLSEEDGIKITHWMPLPKHP